MQGLCWHGSIDARRTVFTVNSRQSISSDRSSNAAFGHVITPDLDRVGAWQSTVTV